MCGIAGYTGPAIPDLSQRMAQRIRHRGPDDSGLYDHPDVHLAMVRLAIIDLARGHQPLSNEDGSVWIVFNGEIYNYLELRETLEAKGHRFRTDSDTEVIVHAYEEWGTSVAHHLNGMFAIALWDARNDTLYVLRDRMGVKPLFYSQLNGQLVFASEIKGVLCHPDVRRDLDPEALSHFLSLRHVPAPLTVYSDVRCLPPGCMLTWRPGHVEVSRWYELPMGERWRDTDEDELVERIDSLLRDSVRLRMRSDVKFGAYLSGGIDSSTVVAMMAELSPGPVRTFTLAYADNPSNKSDASFARLVANQYGTEHHEYALSMEEMGNELPLVLDHLDQPFAGVISSYWLTRFIRQHVKVTLSGDGADDLFGSYGHHRLVAPIAALQRPNGEDVSGLPVRARELAPYAPWEWRLAYAAFMEHEKAQLLSERGTGMLGEYSTPLLLKNLYQSCPPGADDLNRMLYLDQRELLPNEVLYFNDLLSMAHSVEVREPFLDYRLVELASQIPGSLKIRGGVLKYVLRRVAERYLPRQILDRPKEGFVLPNNIWLRTGLSSLVSETLAAPRLALHGLFDQDYVDGLVRRFLGGDEALTFKVWTLIVFQLWYERKVT